MMYKTMVDFETLAQEQLSPSVWAFLKSGSEREISKQENELSYQKIRLLPKVLTETATVDLSLSLLGQSLDIPILAAPLPFQKLYHPQGELETLLACERAGTLMVTTAYSTVSLKELRQKSSLKPWFQFYWLKDKVLLKSLLSLVTELGYGALVLTVDLPVYAKRDEEYRFPLEESIVLPDLSMLSSGKESAKALSQLLDPLVSWKDIEWLRDHSSLPIVLKGILRPEDAKRALQLGVDAVIVSNHGGRQLDTVVTPIEQLPKIVDSVQGEIPILIDGGIRRGTDILKAIALGANAVLLGRPIVWGLIEGQVGVSSIFDLLLAELTQAMIFCGCNRLGAIKRDVVI